MVEYDENGESYDYSISDFIKDMPSPKLSNCWRNSLMGSHQWVFWNDDHHSPQTQGILGSIIVETPIKEKIKTALHQINQSEFPDGDDILIQFWAPATVGSRHVLTTLNQPFSLSRIERGLCYYRNHCTSYEFNVDEEVEELGGLPGRVFHYNHMESTISVGYYSTKDYPQRDFAVKCGIERFLALPVFERSAQCCVGVLELVDNKKSNHFPHTLYYQARNVLKAAEVQTYIPFNFMKLDIIAQDEITEALEVVCRMHQLPLAQAWTPVCFSSYLSCSKRFSSIYKDGDVDMYNMLYDFNAVCYHHHLRKGRGLVGMAFLLRKPCFCGDVTRLPLTEYPLSHYACKYGLTSSFAICLYTSSGNLNYVLEFFLPSCNMKNRGDHQQAIFLDSLMATVKKHIWAFKIYPGEGLGEELSVQIVTLSVNDERDSLQNERDEREMAVHQNKVTVERIVEDELNNVFIEEPNDNDKSITCLEKIVEIPERDTTGDEVEEELSFDVKFATTEKICEEVRLLHMVKNALETREAAQKYYKSIIESTVRLDGYVLPCLESPKISGRKLETTGISFNDEVVQQQDGKKLLLDEDISTMEAVRMNNLDAVIAEQKDVAAETSEREHRRTITKGGSLNREDLKQHFGKKLDDAAEILGVSRSTMKRACRISGIKKWPFPKRKKLKPSPSNLKRVHKFVQHVSERVPEFGIREASCSNPPPVHATGGGVHTICNVTPTQNVETMTVKAAYGVEIIRFQLPFSSTRVDLVEKVTKRLSLKDGTFNIKYEDDDGDWVLIACDEDVEECIGISKRKSIIKMLVQPIN